MTPPTPSPRTVATTPPPPTAPDQPPRRDTLSAPAQRETRSPGRRWVGWVILATIALLGLYLYFAHARSVVPLRVTS